MENKNYKDEQFDSFLTKTIILSSKRYFKKEINTNRKEQIIFDDQNYSAFIQGFFDSQNPNFESTIDLSLSVKEALKHAGYKYNTKVNINWIDSESLENPNVDLKEVFKNSKGILVPGGFGSRGIEGKIKACEYARKNKVPYLGICLGMQVAVIEFARNVCNIKDASSREFEELCKNPVIDLMSEQKTIINKGGTLRLGNYNCKLKKNTLAYKDYGETLIKERHRHRYEFNNAYRDILEKNGLIISGINPETGLVEIIELKDHPHFIASQFHPEFKSRPNRPHPLFTSFIKASIEFKN